MKKSKKRSKKNVKRPPGARLRAWVGNLLLVGTSLLSLILVGEFVVFRFILKGSDIPTVTFDSGIIRYEPNQTGVTRVGDDVEARYRINSSGWNSGHEEYDTGGADAPRIVLIGDSYIHAAAVDYDQSVAEILERTLGDSNVEVYRFGLPGAPMSQYLHVLRHVSRLYAPDIAVFLLTHNDFNESYEFKQGTYTSSFLKLRIADDGAVEELPPRRHERRWYDAIREKSATWRYLVYRRGLRLQILRDLILGTTARSEASSQPVSSPAPQAASTLTRQAADSIATAYVLREAVHLGEQSAFEFFVMIDGDRQGIYEGGTTGRYVLNTLVQSVAGDLEIPFLDLHRPFEKDYATNGRKFDFESDFHWNAYAHRLAARELARQLEPSVRAFGAPPMAP